MGSDIDPRPAVAGGRYTVVYEGSPTDARILNGEPAPGLPVTITLGDSHDEATRLRAKLAAAQVRQAERDAEITRLSAENDVLRASAANGGGPCVYCTLPRSRWAECERGFPGCPRGDDAMLCPHVGAELETADKLAAAEARLAEQEWLSQAEIVSLTRALAAAEARASKAVDEGRRAGLEEAARVAEAQPFYPDTHTGMRQQWVKDQIAKSIRALLTTEATTTRDGGGA